MKGIQLLKFLPVLLLYYGADNVWGRYTPKYLTGSISACLRYKETIWTLEEKLNALVVGWRENLLMYNLESSF